MREEPMVIVGAGEAGVAAAAAIRETYAGPVMLVSAETETPYERPPLSKEMLLEDTPAFKPIRPIAWYEEQGIELHCGREVVAIDALARQLIVQSPSGERVFQPYGQLLLATGARVRRLAGDDAGVFYLRAHHDGLRLRQALREARSVTVVGAGVIGLEVASSAQALGLAVTVLDMGPRLMARGLTPEVSDFLAARHRAAGVNLRLGVRGLRLLDSRTVELEDGERLASDLIVAGIGVEPDTTLARMAGCRIDNGIVVDGEGRTSVEGIFAAGDVAAFHHPLFDRPMRVESWQHAGRHGVHVGRAMVGAQAAYCEVPWFWTDQSGVNLQVAGSIVGVDHTVWRGETARTAFHFAAGRLVATTTIDNGRDMRPATKLIAAGYAGDPAALTDATLPLGKLVTSLLTPSSAAAA